jgi:hypothetical protein
MMFSFLPMKTDPSLSTLRKHLPEINRIYAEELSPDGVRPPPLVPSVVSRK